LLAAVLYGQEDLRLETVADPTPAADEVAIKVGAATTWGTDLKVWRRGGDAKMLKPPTRFGHEAAGEIVAVGSQVLGWQVGDRVVANNSGPCMKWFFCQGQEYSLCPNLTWNNGKFAEYLKITAQIVKHNLWRLPEDLPDALASMTEPLAWVLHGVARSKVKRVNSEQLHYSELTLLGVFHNTPLYVREALSLLASRTIPLELMVSEHRPLRDLEQVFRDMKARKSIKVAMVTDV
jgi:threonine dehydrogenase-like Zn-dependent dehydrogenase